MTWGGLHGACHWPETMMGTVLSAHGIAGAPQGGARLHGGHGMSPDWFGAVFGRCGAARPGQRAPGPRRAGPEFYCRARRWQTYGSLALSSWSNPAGLCGSLACSPQPKRHSGAAVAAHAFGDGRSHLTADYVALVSTGRSRDQIFRVASPLGSVRSRSGARLIRGGAASRHCVSQVCCQPQQ